MNKKHTRKYILGITTQCEDRAREKTEQARTKWNSLAAGNAILLSAKKSVCMARIISRNEHIATIKTNYGLRTIQFCQLVTGEINFKIMEEKSA